MSKSERLAIESLMRGFTAQAIRWLDWRNPINGNGSVGVVRDSARWAAHYGRKLAEDRA